MEVKNGVDVSSLLLVEESADSEVNSLTGEMCPHDGVTATGDEDDAESCSFDASEIQAEGFDYDHDHDEEFSDVDERRRLSWTTSSCKVWWADGDHNEEEEEEYSSWDINGINNNVSRKAKDEMEDGLFWETCMAVGYP